MSKTDPAAIEALSNHFSAGLQGYLTSAEYVKLALLQRDHSEPGICHSGDFCDSNQIMIDAFGRAFEVELDTNSDQDMRLVDCAWTMSKARLFKLPSGWEPFAGYKAQQINKTIDVLEPTDGDASAEKHTPGELKLKDETHEIVTQNCETGVITSRRNLREFGLWGGSPAYLVCEMNPACGSGDVTANAARLCLCWNMHDELVKTLKYYIKLEECGLAEPPDHQCGTPDSNCDGACVDYERQQERRRGAKVLLAKIKQISKAPDITEDKPAA